MVTIYGEILESQERTRGLVSQPHSLLYYNYCIYRTASLALLRPARCYAPPYFRNYCIVTSGSITRPPPGPLAGRSSRFTVLQFLYVSRVASVEDLYLCIKHVENSLRTGLGRSVPIWYLLNVPFPDANVPLLILEECKALWGLPDRVATL